MKKRHFAVALALLGTLTSCQLLEGLNVDSPLDEKVELVKNALLDFDGDFNVTFELSNSRVYDTPFMNEYNITNIYKITNKYLTLESGLTRFENTITSKKSTDEEFSTPEVTTGLFDTTGALYKEYLNNKNEVFVRKEISDSNGDAMNVFGELSENILRKIDADELEVSLESDVVKYSGEVFSYYAMTVLGFNGTVESANLTLSDGKFTSFEVTFNPTESRFGDNSYGGDNYVETLTMSGTIVYETPELVGLVPAENPKVTAIDDVLNKFKNSNNNFTVTLSPLYTFDNSPIQVLFDGEKTVVDFYEIMDEANLESFGTFSYFDARLDKDENGKFFLNNLSINEDTMVYELLPTKDLIESVESTINEKSVLFDAGKFDLGIDNLDSSLFTLNTDKVYDLNPNAAKYFGESCIPTIIDYSALSIMSGTYVQYTWCGVDWALELVDDSTFILKGHFKWGDSANGGTSELSLKFSNPGTTDVSAFYAEELPVLPL